MSGSALLHRPPRARVVARQGFLEEAVRGKRAIHLGFVDTGLMTVRRASGSWLHDTLAASASELVGIDADEEGVALARSLGYDAHVADCQSAEGLSLLGLEPADIVVAGELIEHLDRPGAFLDAVSTLLRPGGVLVLTTPNALRLTNVLASLLRREVVSSDHVAWYSWRTLETLLGRHGLTVVGLAYYPIQHLPAGHELPLQDRILVRAYNLARVLARPLIALSPLLADGLIVTAAVTPSRDST